MPPQTKRSRFNYALLAALTIAFGLASRRFSHFLPEWMAKNAGDVLYAVMVYWLLGLCLPRLSPRRRALGTFLFCLGIELLKFVQAPWLIAARHSAAGRLVFGVGFHWFNLVCYALGAALSWGAEQALIYRKTNTR